MATARTCAATLASLTLVGAVAAAAAEAPPCDGPVRLNLIVEGVRSAKGDLVLELYRDDEAGFLKAAGRVERVRRRAERPETGACFVVPAQGRYAVVIYHDENGDHKFNRSIIGLPAEGFGLTNNVRPRIGAPSLQSVLVQVPDGESTVRVQMQYLSRQRD